MIAIFNIQSEFFWLYLIISIFLVVIILAAVEAFKQLRYELWAKKQIPGEEIPVWRLKRYQWRIFFDNDFERDENGLYYRKK